MDTDDIPALKAQVKNIVRNADARGDIDAGLFTLKIAKQQIANALGVAPEVLSQKPWKQMVKNLVFEAIENVDALRSSPVKPSSPSKDSLAFIRGLLSEEEREEREVMERNRGKGGGTAKRRGGNGNDDHPIHSSPVKSEASTSSIQDIPPPPRKKTKRVVDEGSDVGLTASPKEGKKNKRKEDGAGKGKESAKPTPKPIAATASTSATASASTSTPMIEDDRVKELKSIVVACGVRKQWKKEFQGMETANEQIAHLKSLLAALGMKGQPSKGKAKAIKEKREMAAELGDVLEFEAKRGLGITRNRKPNGRSEGDVSPRGGGSKARSARGRGRAHVGSDDSEEDDKANARAVDVDVDAGTGSEGDVKRGKNGTGAKQRKRKAIASSDVDSDSD